MPEIRSALLLTVMLVSPTRAFAQRAPEPAPSTSPPASASPTAPSSGAAPTGVAPPGCDGLRIGAFADAYYALNLRFPHPEAGSNVGFGGPGGNLGRAYDFNDGFSLHWAGVDASYAYGDVGGTVSVRLGPSTAGYDANDAAFGAQLLKQAFATWRPFGAGGKLTLDFGKFDQPFGSEVADSQQNANYTRSFLYWLAQPLHFTGLRADYAVSERVDVKVFAVNGWNRVVDDNAMKSLGAQITLTPSDAAAVMLGYMAGPEQDDAAVAADGVVTKVAGADARWRHFLDLVIDLKPTSTYRILGNADYGTEKKGDGTRSKWYGANVVVNVKLGDRFFVAPRGEIYVDDDFDFGSAKRRLESGTLTFGYAPSPNLVIKLDGRGDFADAAIFPTGSLGAAKSQWTATLGVVASTN